MEPALSHLLELLHIDLSTVDTLVPSDATPIYYAAVSTETLPNLWDTARSLVEESGYWPMVLGDEEEVEHHRQNCEYSNRVYLPPDDPDAEMDARDEPSPQEILIRAQGTDAAQWLQAIRELRGVLEEEDWEWEADDEDLPGEESHLYDDLAKEESPADEFSTFQDWKWHSVTITYLGFIPTRRSHEVPAFLRYGGWNCCPHPQEHVVLLERWEQVYGAEIVVVRPDVIEMRVGRPPQSREAALPLAEEQFAYCPTEGTLSILATTLVGRRTWFFWWD